MSVETIQPAASRLGAFIGEPDFNALPDAVQLAIEILGEWAGEGAPASERAPTQAHDAARAAMIAKGPPTTKPTLQVTIAKAEEAAKAKADAAADERLRAPGGGRAAVAEILRDIAERVIKQHPQWSEAKAMSWALENDSDAIAWYTRGEVIEREARRPR